MTDECATAPLVDGVELLERAINYTLGGLRLVTPHAMSRRTPCRDWDLRALLRHLTESVTVLHEAIDTGRIDLDASDDEGDPTVDPVATLRDRACQLLGACADAHRPGVISIAGHPLTTGLLTGTGALEVAVHGWDVARACGVHRPIPPPLAEEMLLLSPLLVTDADRPGQFAAPVQVPALASPGDRLIAYLGRNPR
jgi:uncharacterized protein (TIGR03086 family)